MTEEEMQRLIEAGRERELRLRRRIDLALEERDRARDEADRARARAGELRRSLTVAHAMLAARRGRALPPPPSEPLPRHGCCREECDEGCPRRRVIDALAERLEAVMPAESHIDIREHAIRIAAAVVDAREDVACR